MKDYLSWWYFKKIKKRTSVKMSVWHLPHIYVARKSTEVLVEPLHSFWDTVSRVWTWSVLVGMQSDTRHKEVTLLPAFPPKPFVWILFNMACTALSKQMLCHVEGENWMTLMMNDSAKQGSARKWMLLSGATERETESGRKSASDKEITTRHAIELPRI